MGKHERSTDRSDIMKEARDDGRQTDGDGYRAGAGSRGEDHNRAGGGERGEAGHGDTPNR